MVIDSSVVVAILSGEPGSELFLSAIEDDENCVISNATVLETKFVMLRKYGPEGAKGVDKFLFEAGVDLADLNSPQTEIAYDGYERFGKGQGHPAQLNMGDCFSYALAIYRSDMLLFKSNDFSHTEVEIADI